MHAWTGRLDTGVVTNEGSMCQSNACARGRPHGALIGRRWCPCMHGDGRPAPPLRPAPAAYATSW